MQVLLLRKYELTWADFERERLQALRDLKIFFRRNGPLRMKSFFTFQDDLPLIHDRHIHIRVVKRNPPPRNSVIFNIVGTSRRKKRFTRESRYIFYYISRVPLVFKSAPTRNPKLRAFPFKGRTKRVFSVPVCLLLKINRDIFRLQRIVHRIRQRSSVGCFKASLSLEAHERTSIVVHAYYIDVAECTSMHTRAWDAVAEVSRRVGRFERNGWKEEGRGGIGGRRGVDGLDFARR